MSQKNFGVGLLQFTPPGANPTPIGCGILQDVSVDFAQSVKELVGSRKVAEDIAESELKITGKAKFAQIQGAAIAAFLAGSTQATGTTIGALNEVATIPATPFTVTTAHASTYVENLRVFNATTGLEMTRVASSPATGQYSVNTSTGVYTFASADAGSIVWISYSYTSTGGQTVSFSNQLMGQGTTFTLTLYNIYSTYSYGIKLWAVVFPKFSLAFKNTDYTMADLEFQAYSDPQSRIFSQYTTE